MIMGVRGRYRKAYKKKIVARLMARREFLMRRLKRDWDELEHSAKRERRVQQAKDAGAVIGKILLGLLVVGGVLTVAAIAPNLFGAMGRSLRRGTFFHKESFIRSKDYLRRHGLIRVTRVEGQYAVSLTKKGLTRAVVQSFKEMTLAKTARWDGWWRVIIFDIPERDKWAREGFREKLKVLGLFQLQKSVFVTPYPCEEEVSFLVSVFSIASFVRLLKTKDLSADEELCSYFGVPRPLSQIWKD